MTSGINLSQRRALLSQRPFHATDAPYWPMDVSVGIGTPNDNTQATLRVCSNRAFQLGVNNGVANNPGGGFYNLGYVAINGIYNLPSASQDATTGLPLTAFTIKICEGAPQSIPDPAVIGTWCVRYRAAAQLTVAATFGAAVITSSIFSAGVGLVTFTYDATQPLGLNFSGPITSLPLEVYAPDTAAVAIAGGIPNRFTQAYFNSIAPYSYLRMMDAVYANQDFVSIGTTTWPLAIGWSDRATEANIYNGTMLGRASGLPLEWQIDLCNQANKNAWLNMPILADDNYITQFATMVAQQLNPGKWAVFELANERWNFAGGFFNYRKSGVAAMLEAKAAQPCFCVAAAGVTFSSDGTTATVTCTSQHAATNGTLPSFSTLQSGYTGFAPTGPLTVVSDSSTHVFTYPCSQASTGGSVAGTTVLGASGFIAVPLSEWSTRQYGQSIVSLASDGTTATVVFTQPHGATTGGLLFVSTAKTGYTGFKPTNGTTLTVVDAHTITYPCTQANTSGPVAANTVFALNSIICCDASGTLFTNNNIVSVYELGKYWFHRRQFQVATLIRAAFTAVGRTLTDCLTIQMWNATAKYSADTSNMQAYILSVFGQPLFPTFQAAAMGAYYDLDLPGSMNSGFGFTAGTGTPTSQATLLAQLRTFVDHCYGAYNYPAFIGFCRQAGLTPMIYEAGVDTTTASGTATAYASGANSDPLMLGLTRDWIYNLLKLGFKKIGYYSGGCGFQSGGGCFNLGRLSSDVDTTQPLSSQSPKSQGLQASLVAPGIIDPYHTWPCTISAFDIVGNEAVITGANYPALNGTNIPSTNGSSFGYTMRFKSEIARTIAITMNGHTTSTAQTVTATVVGTGVSSSWSVPAHAGSNTNMVSLGGCLIAVPAGPSYIQFTSAGAASIFPHIVQFS